MARTSIFQAIRTREDLDEQVQVSPSVMPAYENSYQNKLRLVGVNLDRNNMRRAKILEVPGGLLVRAARSDNVTEELLEFPDESFERFFADAINQRGGGKGTPLRIKSELIPTSYSDVLRAVGFYLDGWMTRSIIISEGSEGIYVSGLRLLETSVQSRYSPFDELFTPETIDSLLTEAYERRGRGTTSHQTT